MNHIKNSLFIILFFGLASCKTLDTQDGSIIAETNGHIEMEEIYAVVNVYPSSGLIIADAIYVLPTKQWIENEFSIILNTKLKNKYKLEAYDCDNFAIGAENVASEINAKANHQLAIGEFYYIRDDRNQGHAINFFLYKEGNNVKIGFIEPQNGKIIDLSEKEILSCSYWRI